MHQRSATRSDAASFRPCKELAWLLSPFSNLEKDHEATQLVQVRGGTLVPWMLIKGRLASASVVWAI